MKSARPTPARSLGALAPLLVGTVFIAALCGCSENNPANPGATVPSTSSSTAATTSPTVKIADNAAVDLAGACAYESGILTVETLLTQASAHQGAESDKSLHRAIAMQFKEFGWLRPPAPIDKDVDAINQYIAARGETASRFLATTSAERNRTSC